MICYGILFGINVLETLVMMLMTVFAHAMMFMTMVAFAAEAVVQILTNLFKKSQQLLLFVNGKGFEYGMIDVMGAACLCLRFSGIGQRDVHSPSIRTVTLADD